MPEGKTKAVEVHFFCDYREESKNQTSADIGSPASKL